MRPDDPVLYLILTSLHLPLSTSLILPTPPSLGIRNPTFPEPTPPPSQQLAQNPSCALLSQALSICAVLTPSFVNLLPPQQAHCLCYSSTVWAPNVLDDAVKTCADFASTAAPGAFPPLMNLEGFCLSVGDVDKDAPASVTATPTGRIPGAGMGGTHGNPNEGTPGSNYVPPSLPTYGVGNGSGGNSGQGGSGDGLDGSNGGSGSGSGGQGGGSSAGGLPTSTAIVSSGSIGLDTLTPTTSFPGMTITVVSGGAGATKTADGAVRNRGEVTETEVVLVSLAIAALILFL
ncbi:hypothetical protein DL95DRAFT_479450 [Leptodontidium sp. 2 PMI_412]|nr:hypothetical protein DL95DRAFT_479450 [Leptodontidium sp. 2 PMI_412]